MDEEVDPAEENVNVVLAQESRELFQVLSAQSPAVMKELYRRMPTGHARKSLDATAAATGSSAAELANAMLEYLTVASDADRCSLLQSMCILCEDMPMRLESRLMSVAGYANHENSTSTHSVTDEESSWPQPEEQRLMKRPRIDHWGQYIAEVTRLMRRRWQRLSEGLVKEVHLETVWISPRPANRGRDRDRDRTDQTPAQTDRASRTPEPDGDFGSPESRVTLDSFLQGCEGKVTVVVGLAGSGKTLLMSCLGEQWASGLGPIPLSCLFVLLEFRQLNLLSGPLSLSELLFRHYLPPHGGDDAKRAIVDYLLSNPEQSCWVLDGYDEFHDKLARQEAQAERLSAENPLPVADLVSGLLSRQLLPGCTVLVTCRARDVVDLDGASDKVGQLLGWDCADIREYVDNFFGVKGDSANKGPGQKAADLLLSNQHLLAMSYLPALCNICCICLKHLLQEDKEQSGGGVQAAGGRRRGRNEEDMDGRAQPSHTQIPSTLTQVYLTVLDAFQGKRDKAKATKRPPSSAYRQTALSHCQSEMCELAELAWRGLEESKILFLKENIPANVLDFSIRTGLLSQVELRLADGFPAEAYCFIHLTVQEFLAAVRIMSSDDVSDSQLKKRFSLKTRWTTKSHQRTVFTDSLHLYVCGLASKQCTPALVQFARASGRAGLQSWVPKRQALVLKLLKSLCHTNTLTGPKILELCHCVQESQDQQLAKEAVGARSTLELRNIRLLPKDIDALAFVVNSVGENGIGLDFRACSMELECLDVLQRCRYIHHLSFRSRKYDDRFAEKLSSILSDFPLLRKLEFCGASLTATGAASLASALEKCPHVTDVNLSDNSLKDDGIKLIADVVTKLSRLESVMFSRNNSSLQAVDYLIGKMSSHANIQRVHADAVKELTVTFYPSSDMESHKKKTEPTVSLVNQKWTKPEMQKVAKSLARCPALSVLDLSGDQWDVDILETLTQLLPKFNVTNKILLNGSCSSVDDLVVMTALLCHCPAVVELHIRLQSDPDPAQVSVVYPAGSKRPANTKTLCLSCCGLLHKDLERVWTSLGTSCDLTVLDLSSNSLGNKGLKKVLDVLPHLSNIQEVDVSNNDISMEGVATLASALSSSNNFIEINISEGGRGRVILKFCSDRSDDKQKLKIFRINDSSLLPADVNTLCRKLVDCGSSHLELDLSHNTLKAETIQSLLSVLPEMVSLQTLNFSNSIASFSEALMLVDCLTVSQRVTSVELRPHGECVVHFDRVKAERAKCRFTHFCLNGGDMERLMEVLLQGPHLSVLDLSRNQLTDDGVERLVDSLPKLKITSFVSLSNNTLSQQGLMDVANTLRTCDDVSAVDVSLGEERKCLIWFSQHRGCEKSLSIRGSGLEQEHLLRLSEVVSHCPTLTTLQLKNNSLHSEWIGDFVKALDVGERGCSVSVEESWMRAEKAVALVCRCLQLSSDIHAIRVQSTTLHVSLMKSSGLTSVSLVDCSLEGPHLSPLMDVIHECPLLTELDFSHSSLSTEGTRALCSVLPSLPKLTSVSVVSKQTCSVTAMEELSEALLQSAAVQRLNLSGHVISDTAAQNISAVFPRLRALNLSHCSWSAAEGLQLVKALRRCVHLEELCLDSVRLDDSGRQCLTETLRNLRSLRSLKLNKMAAVLGPSETNAALDLLASMEGLTRLEEIELDGWRMSDRGVEQLSSRLLPCWTELRKIRLTENLIDDRSGDILLEALIDCSRLQELYLCSNRLGDLTAARMSLVLPVLTHITVLDISVNVIGREGSVSLSRAILAMKNLTKIHLTSVGTAELCPVAASLCHCPLIQEVSLGWNKCGDDVVMELARVLTVCLKMNRIDLESNCVTVVGVEALLRVLQSCPALQIIRLWRNKVSPSEAQRLSLKDRRLNFSST